jgi:HSP20 family molecular chaperone IbpA
MSTIHWRSLGQLWDEFEQAHNDMDRFLRHIDARGAAALPGVQAAYPPVNIWGDDENIYLKSELPGITLKIAREFYTGSIGNPSVWPVL